MSARHPVRPLYALIALGVANHGAMAGTRLTVSLEALARGASPFVVGVLIALYSLLPMLLAVAAGRMSDRVGVRRPMVAGSAGIAAGAVLPFLFPGLPALFVAATLVGVSFMTFQVAAQNATGELGAPGERARSFSLLALGYSTSGFLGPLAAGFAIDHFGFAATFGMFALVPLVPFAVLRSRRLVLPPPHPARPERASGGVRALLTHRTLRRVFAINVLLALGWDLHTVFVPIYGAKIGLSASQVGVILAAFAAATFVVRFAMPAISRRANEHQVLAAALLVAAAAYAAFPFVERAGALMTVSFCLGLGLGCGQPMVMSLLHAHAPPGRMGEAAGVRMSLVNAMSVAVPLVFGALGASVGIGPVFWTVGALLGAGGLLARRG
jgi:MFS family permease